MKKLFLACIVTLSFFSNALAVTIPYCVEDSWTCYSTTCIYGPYGPQPYGSINYQHDWCPSHQPPCVATSKTKACSVSFCREATYFCMPNGYEYNYCDLCGYAGFTYFYTCDDCSFASCQ